MWLTPIARGMEVASRTFAQDVGEYQPANDKRHLGAIEPGSAHALRAGIAGPHWFLVAATSVARTPGHFHCHWNLAC